MWIYIYKLNIQKIKRWIAVAFWARKMEIDYKISVFAKLIFWSLIQEARKSKWSLNIRAIPRKPRPNLLNRGPHQILLNLIYIVKGSVLWIMAQAVSKNIEPSIVTDTHTYSPTSDHFPKRGYKCDHISRSAHAENLKFFARIHLSEL